ncbi:MAG: hypothetical protein IJV04_02830, partial [Lachnospiraceae bacterium]|nr:hypothetical protein [Lachnospiraceae bacterium]
MPRPAIQDEEREDSPLLKDLTDYNLVDHLTDEEKKIEAEKDKDQVFSLDLDEVAGSEYNAQLDFDIRNMNEDLTIETVRYRKKDGSARSYNIGVVDAVQNPDDITMESVLGAKGYEYYLEALQYSEEDLIPLGEKVKYSKTPTHLDRWRAESEQVENLFNPKK